MTRYNDYDAQQKQRWQKLKDDHDKSNAVYDDQNSDGMGYEPQKTKTTPTNQANYFFNLTAMLELLTTLAGAVLLIVGLAIANPIVMAVGATLAVAGVASSGFRATCFWSNNTPKPDAAQENQEQLSAGYGY